MAGKYHGNLYELQSKYLGKQNIWEVAACYQKNEETNYEFLVWFSKDSIQREKIEEENEEEKEEEKEEL